MKVKLCSMFNKIIILRGHVKEPIELFLVTMSFMVGNIVWYYE